MKERVINSAVEVLDDPMASARDKAAASRVVIAAEQQNQKDEQASQLQHDRNRFLAIATRLGIGDAVIGTSAIGASDAGQIIDAIPNGRPRQECRVSEGSPE